MNNETDAIIAAIRQAVAVDDTARIVALAKDLATELTRKEDEALAYFEGQR
jgi:hypothetical protein